MSYLPVKKNVVQIVMQENFEVTNVYKDDSGSHLKSLMLVKRGGDYVF